MTELQARDLKKIGGRVRAYRKLHKLSLNDIADHVRKSGGKRPSEAKLSRIETGVQPVSLDILPILSELTGIPPAELRPDLAVKFMGPARGQAA